MLSAINDIMCLGKLVALESTCCFPRFQTRLFTSSRNAFSPSRLHFLVALFIHLLPHSLPRRILFCIRKTHLIRRLSPVTVTSVPLCLPLGSSWTSGTKGSSRLNATMASFVFCFTSDSPSSLSLQIKLACILGPGGKLFLFLQFG